MKIARVEECAEVPPGLSMCEVRYRNGGRYRCYYLRAGRLFALLQTLPTFRFEWHLERSK